MAIDIQKLYALPDISFIEDISYEQILNEMIGDYADFPIHRNGSFYQC